MSADPHDNLKTLSDPYWSSTMDEWPLTEFTASSPRGSREARTLFIAGIDDGSELPKLAESQKTWPVHRPLLVVDLSRSRVLASDFGIVQAEFVQAWSVVMRPCKRLVAGLALIGLLACASPAGAPTSALERPPIRCVPDSPERRGEEGCTILASRPLVTSTAAPLYWHIDRYDTLDAANNAAGPDSVAAEAHGAVWLMTVEGRAEQHHVGHIAWLGPLTLPAAERYIMRVQSTLLMPGGGTPVHTHSGPEVFYVVSGEQCVETEPRAHRLRPESSLVCRPIPCTEGGCSAPALDAHWRSSYTTLRVRGVMI